MNLNSEDLFEFENKQFNSMLYQENLDKEHSLIKGWFIILFLILTPSLFAQNNDSLKRTEPNVAYPFIIQDSPARLFTMRQFSQDYLSTYRFTSSILDKSFKPIVKYSIQSVAMILFCAPITHEEGHRSILSSKNIGSISQPFFYRKEMALLTELRTRR